MLLSNNTYKNIINVDVVFIKNGVIVPPDLVVENIQKRIIFHLGFTKKRSIHLGFTKEAERRSNRELPHEETFIFFEEEPSRSLILRA